MPKFHWGKSVFPLLCMKIKDQGISMGTCYCVAIDKYVAFVTARHVIGDNDRDSELHILTRYGSSQSVKFSGAVSIHLATDTAVLIPNAEFMKANSNELQPLTISPENLEMGDDVFTLGYPLADINGSGAQSILNIDIRTFLFKGYVTSFEDSLQCSQKRNNCVLNFAGPQEPTDTLSKGMKNNYVLNFAGIQGLSGAPLLRCKGDAIQCVGHIYGSIMLPIFYKGKATSALSSYGFALAHDSAALLELESILHAA